MTIEEIIKTNEAALDAGDFTTLLPSIPFLDSDSWSNLCDVLYMLSRVGVEPFWGNTPTTLTTAVVRLKEVFRPTNKNIGVIVLASEFSLKYVEYESLFNALGVSTTHGYFKSNIDDSKMEYYLLFIAEDGLGDKIQYWENVLGRKWEEIK